MSNPTNTKVNTSGGTGAVTAVGTTSTEAGATGAGAGDKTGGFKMNASNIMSAGLPMLQGALSSAKNYTLKDLNSQQRNEWNAIYGRGDDPIFDLAHLSSDTKNIVKGILNTAYTKTGVLGSNNDLMSAYKGLNLNQYNPNNKKINFLQANVKNLEASAKGAQWGSAFGPWGMLIGGIIGGVADIGSYIGAGKRRDRINDAKELAKNMSLASYNLQVANSQNLWNLNMLRNMNTGAMGGSLEYGFLNLYNINNYIDTMNNSKITSMPNSFYKPQFESMNYFADGGNMDFTEFNTGGTHELNSLGGIPLGYDKQGNLNTVEQGETKTTTPDGEYIFSDRLKLSKLECKDLGIPENSTYAKASKILRKEYDERPNDLISKRGWEQFRDMLIESQELQKQELALKEMREQGINSPKMLGIDPNIMQQMPMQLNPQEEMLMQGMNPEIALNAFGGYIQYGPGGFLKKVLDLMRSPEMRHAISNANIARRERNYENSTKVEDITENNYLEENGIPIHEINMNRLLTTPQGDSTWMYNNERINGNNSQFNNINVSNNPLTGNYTYETYNGATGNHVFEEEIPRNELPQEVLNIMNYDYSGNKEYKKGGYVKKFAGGSFLNPDNPPNKNTYTLNNNGYTYVYKNVPDNIFSQMRGNLETADINDVIDQANNPNREWDLYLDLDQSILPEGYIVNKPTTALNPTDLIREDQLFSDGITVTDTSLYTPLTTRKTPLIPVDNNVNVKYRENKPVYSVLEDPDATKNKGNNQFDLEKLRYAPVLGNLAAAIKNAFTKPDYKYADRLDLIALRINPNIPTPGNYNYMTYNPVDIQRYLNNYNAQANAARQGVMNTTNPSRNAALLAAQYNDLSGRGDLMQSIDLVNKKHYNDVIVRNNEVNAQKNADALNIANANFTRQQYQLGLMQQANALRQAEDEGLRAARAQQWSNALDSIGALGQEASANNIAESWFRLSKLAPGLTYEEFVKYSLGKGTLEPQDDGKYKFVEK